MSELMKIQPFIQSYVQAVSSILGSEVTIVDNDLMRVGGTGIYRDEIGETVPHGSFFKSIMENGKPGILKDARKEFICENCPKRDTCQEMSNIAFPILKGDAVVGVIAVIAFNEEQRARLLADHEKLEDFLKYMSALMESKLISTEVNLTLTRQISHVTEQQNLDHGFDRIIGSDPRFLEAMSLAKKVASSQSSVMLRGESGTGKELFAKAIHSASTRNNRILVTVNCAAIPEHLVESELFGYEEGAFTGASRKGHVGKFELAHRSTIFLDEIGDMPLSAQVKLLRVLQEQVVERVGGGRPIPIDVRVICATNRNLEEMVRQGFFREDLYYRLNVIPIYIPPLRERREDIPDLLHYFVQYYGAGLGKQIAGLSPEVGQIMRDYDWPGNIRELRNIVEYMINIAERPVLTISDLPDHLLIKAIPEQNSLEGLVEEFEKKIILSLIQGGESVADKQAVARRLGISPATLYRKLKKYRPE